MLTFITGNSNKLAEVQAILGPVKHVSLDLEEIQELDPRKVIAHKLEQARNKVGGPIMVEDTSLYAAAFKLELPGTFIKWFIKAIGLEGIYKMIKNMGNTQAMAITFVGYTDSKSASQFFFGTLRGDIVAPRGPQKFGWDPIFMPHGSNKSLAEMTPEEKNKISMRSEALGQLKQYLSKH